MKHAPAPDKMNVGFGDNFTTWVNLLGSLPRVQVLKSVIYGAFRIGATALWPFLLYRSLKETDNRNDIDIVFNIGLVILLLGLASLAAHKQSAINIQIIKSFTLETIDRLWCKMNSLDWLTFHSKNRVYYFDMLMVETWRLRAGVIALLESLFINSLIAAFLSLAIIFISLPLFLVCLAGLVVMVAGQYFATISTRPLMKEFHTAWRNQHQWISKSVDQFDLIKMDRAYDFSREKNRTRSDAFLLVNSRLLLQQAKWRNINQMLVNLVRVVVFIMGIYWVRTGYIGLDNLLLVLLIVTVIQSNIMQIPGALNNFTEAGEALRTISEFLALKEDQSGRKKADLKPVRHISICNLSYRYNGHNVLENINFNLEAGKIYLWRGKNGSGKSTVAHILLGLLEPPQGSLSINGKSEAWETLKTLRHRFAFLNQHSPVFGGSIKENVLFGHPEAEPAWEVLHTNWLKRLLPKGRNESQQIGERGEGLSGGEAKRIALIRELLRSSEIIILDEPLNHLDEYAIEEIKREILNIKAETIVIIISHQTGFESIADEIIDF